MAKKIKPAKSKKIIMNAQQMPMKQIHKQMEDHIKQQMHGQVQMKDMKNG